MSMAYQRKPSNSQSQPKSVYSIWHFIKYIGIQNASSLKKHLSSPHLWIEIGFLFGLRKETVTLCILLFYTELFQEIWTFWLWGISRVWNLCLCKNKYFLLHDSIKASAIVSKCISYVDNIFLSILMYGNNVSNELDLYTSW